MEGIEVKAIHHRRSASEWPDTLSNIPYMAKNCKKLIGVYQEAAKAAGVEFDVGALMLFGHVDSNLDNLNSFLVAVKENEPASKITLNTVIALDIFAEYTDKILKGFEKKLHDQDVTIKSLQEALCSLSDGNSK